MFSIIVMLSDIPLYIASLAEQLFGADFSALLDGYNGGIAQFFEALETIFGI